MAQTTFTDGVTLIVSAWLNDVDTVTYSRFGNGSSYTGILSIADTTDATSVSTGSSKNAGGTSIAKALWVGGLANIAGAVTHQSTTLMTGVATFTAQPILSSLTASQAVFTDGSKGLVSVAVTGTGDVVRAASPTLTGTIGAASMTLSGTLGVTGAVAIGGSATSNVKQTVITSGAGQSAILGQTSVVGGFPLIGWNTDTAGDSSFALFATEGLLTTRGSIDYNRAGGATRYNTTSDATLKTLIGDAPREKSIGILASTRLREFYWNHDETRKPQIGPFAQELYETFKGAVSVGGDYTTTETDEEGNEVEVTKYRPWGVDKTAFTFHLVAGWQDHESRIAALEARLQ